MTKKYLAFALLAVSSIILISLGIYRGDAGFVSQTATYGNVDVPETQSWVNKLKPGIADGASGVVYGNFHAEPLIAICILFCLMLLASLIHNTKDLLYRLLCQWTFFVSARIGVLRVAGICPIKRTELGIFPFLNCMACEMATGACPVGIIQWGLVQGNVPYLAVGLILLSALLFGRAICGWFCPFGYVLDVLNRLSVHKIKPGRWFSHLKYISLFFVFIAPLLSTATFCVYLCQSGTVLGLLPYYVTTGLKGLSEAIQIPGWWKSLLGFHLLMTVLLVVGIILVKGRWFCQYLCPLGAFYGLFNKISLFTVCHDDRKCVNCDLCEKICPMGIDLRSSALSQWTNCIRCGRCTRLCKARTFGINGMLDIPYR